MRNKKSIEAHYNKWGYIYAIPFVVAFLIFHFVPMASTVYYAFCDLKHVSIVTEPPVLLVSKGLPWYKNFTDLFKTSTFLISMKNTFVFWVAQTIPEWILAFWLSAVMTDRRLKIRGKWLFRTAFFFPNLMFGPVITNVIVFVFGAVGFGITASMINGFGLTEQDINFFTSEQFLIVAVSVFMHFGITFIYALVGMSSIPTEIFEAAEIDGASRPYTFFHVTLPCMRPIMLFIVILSVVDGICMSDIPSYIANPYDTKRQSITLMIYLQNLLGFSGVYDRASAFCLILLAICLVICGIIYFLLIRDRYEAKLQKQIRKEQREERKAKRLAEKMTR